MECKKVSQNQPRTRKCTLTQALDEKRETWLGFPTESEHRLDAFYTDLDTLIAQNLLERISRHIVGLAEIGHHNWRTEITAL